MTEKRYVSAGHREIPAEYELRSDGTAMLCRWPRRDRSEAAVVPEQVQGYPVTAVAPLAFAPYHLPAGRMAQLAQEPVISFSAFCMKHGREMEYETEDVKFIFVLDEWDFIFHRDFVTDKDKANYIDFLSNLLKDQPYVELAYMTGILPIAKYSSGSELNMFYEYTMASEERFSEYFGFTEEEANMLFARYQSLTSTPHITLTGLQMWYNGYHTKS